MKVVNTNLSAFIARNKLNNARSAPRHLIWGDISAAINLPLRLLKILTIFADFIGLFNLRSHKRHCDRGYAWVVRSLAILTWWIQQVTGIEIVWRVGFQSSRSATQNAASQQVILIDLTAKVVKI